SVYNLLPSTMRSLIKSLNCSLFFQAAYMTATNPANAAINPIIAPVTINTDDPATATAAPSAAKPDTTSSNKPRTVVNTAPIVTIFVISSCCFFGSLLNHSKILPSQSTTFIKVGINALPAATFTAAHLLASNWLLEAAVSAISP